MPATDVYSIEISSHTSGQEIHAKIALNADSPVYAGHFPGFPVTPGVCQVQMVKDILVEVLGIPLQLSKARDIKFNNIHEPGKVNTIYARIKYEMDGHRRIHVNAQLFEGDTKYLSLKGEFEAYG